MIWTLTVNPSLDYNIRLEKLALGAVNRSKGESITAGGKGLNVSMVLKNLGVQSTALAFTGGWTGVKIESLLSRMGIATDFVYLQKGESRINVKIKAEQETEINAQGPVIQESEVDTLMKKLEGLGDGDILVLAGSIPSSLPKDFYTCIMKFLSSKKIDFVVDASGELLVQALACSPFLIKPNNHELGELFGIEIQSQEEALVYAEKLVEKGARNVLVSLADKGAVLLAENGCRYRLQSPKGTVVNSVGAGDSMVAGFLAGWIEKKDYEHALKMGICAGSASAFSSGLATGEKVQELFVKCRGES